MNTKTIKTAFSLLLIALIMTACGGTTTAPTKEIIGTNEGELKTKIEEILKYAGTDLEKAEFSRISTYYLFRNENDFNANVILEIITPDNKDKMAEYSWYDSNDRRNLMNKQDLLISDYQDNVIDKYEKFKDMLFTYKDVEKYITNLPTYCKEALEASGYNEDGYVSDFTLEKGSDLRITVSHKANSSLKKVFNIADDGMHIIKE